MYSLWHNNNSIEGTKGFYFCTMKDFQVKYSLCGLQSHHLYIAAYPRAEVLSLTPAWPLLINGKRGSSQMMTVKRGKVVHYSRSQRFPKWYQHPRQKGKWTNLNTILFDTVVILTLYHCLFCVSCILGNIGDK